jgi:hypothetical protein
MIPKRLRETVERVHGEDGRQRLVILPALLGECRALETANCPYEHTYTTSGASELSGSTVAARKLHAKSVRSAMIIVYMRPF